jgi:hypothetical protein|eukprot:m.73724 g.73724  ORF g.73724 m.73724 type:complete len:51 (-) comp18829_c0_seq3:1384-1536(-)
MIQLYTGVAEKEEEEEKVFTIGGSGGVFGETLGSRTLRPDLYRGALARPG